MRVYRPQCQEHTRRQRLLACIPIIYSTTTTGMIASLHKSSRDPIEHHRQPHTQPPERSSAGMSCWSAAGELAVSATSPATDTTTATTAAALAAARLRTPAIAKSRLRRGSVASNTKIRVRARMEGPRFTACASSCCANSWCAWRASTLATASGSSSRSPVRRSWRRSTPRSRQCFRRLSPPSDR
jgi:hypothetical protein